MSQNTSSDYGILNLEVCDPDLRQRVIQAVHTTQAPKVALTPDQINDIGVYISQLEDALLRYHWGVTDRHQISELLKCSTGLDIEARSGELGAMIAVDA